MNYNIIAYSIYIPTTIVLSIWIAKKLHQNTKAFLIEKFKNNDALASATNNLIQTGFYLLAFGYSFLNMKIYIRNDFSPNTIATTQQAIEELSLKLGGFTMVLGILLFINFIIMLFIQKPKKQHQVPQFTNNSFNA